MLIKIKECEREEWWYADRIGEIFEVTQTENPKGFYVVKGKLSQELIESLVHYDDKVDGDELNVAKTDAEVISMEELNYRFKRCLRALRCYGNSDMWHHGNGIPHRDKPYGEPECNCSHPHRKRKKEVHDLRCNRHKDNKGDGIFYNAFGIIPAQDGWTLAEETLKEIKEKF